jgi:hypothetical protein
MSVIGSFQLYLEMSFVFGLSLCTAANSCTVGNENVVLGLFWGSNGGVKNSSNKVGLCIIAEKMKICTYLHVGKHSYLQDVS